MQLREQRQVVEQKLATAITSFTAIGQLRASSVQTGGQPIYRLTDPTTGRTLCDLCFSELATGSLMDKFCGSPRLYIGAIRNCRLRPSRSRISSRSIRQR